GVVGTSVVEEMGEMKGGRWSKLLRILEGHPFERVGGSVPIRVDVRVVAATNQPLEDNVRAGTFRRDLFFRLQVVEVQVSPLRDRAGDIPVLARHFLQRFVRQTGRNIKEFTPGAVKKRKDSPGRGSARELRTVVERAVALGRGPMTDAQDFGLSSLETSRPPMLPLADAYEPLSLDEV